MECCEIIYICDICGYVMNLMFVVDVELFQIWECCFCGVEVCLNVDGQVVMFEVIDEKVVCIYWDMLMECCICVEFEELFEEWFVFIWVCWGVGEDLMREKIGVQCFWVCYYLIMSVFRLFQISSSWSQGFRIIFVVRLD